MEDPCGREASSFLENLLSHTQFTTHAVKPVFLPRKVGLGYPLVAGRVHKDVIRPVLREARRRKEEERKEADRNREADEMDGSDEEVSKMEYIMEKRRRYK